MLLVNVTPNAAAHRKYDDYDYLFLHGFYGGQDAGKPLRSVDCSRNHEKPHSSKLTWMKNFKLDLYRRWLQTPKWWCIVMVHSCRLLSPNHDFFRRRTVRFIGVEWFWGSLTVDGSEILGSWPGMVLKPYKLWHELPTSTGDRWNWFAELCAITKVHENGKLIMRFEYNPKKYSKIWNSNSIELWC